MLSERKLVFTKENIDTFLKELAKEYRKHGGKNMPAELILIGGASVLINYGFRDMTTDIDAMIQASSGMQDAINIVGERFELPKGWINADFRKTESYSPKIVEFSKYYKEFSHVLTVRTISAEYLIAMKLRSGRQYKSDLSDIIGILAEHDKRGEPISLDQIKLAVKNLYNNWESLPSSSISFIENVMAGGQYEIIYDQIRQDEKDNQEVLLQFNSKYPGVLKEDNVEDITDILRNKGEPESILALLREKRDEVNKRERNRKGNRERSDFER